MVGLGPGLHGSTKCKKGAEKLVVSMHQKSLSVKSSNKKGTKTRLELTWTQHPIAKRSAVDLIYNIYLPIYLLFVCIFLRSLIKICQLIHVV